MENARVNVADHLKASAQAAPDRLALLEAWGKHRQITFAQIDRDADTLARGLIELGVVPQLRLALLVKPSIEFVTLVFALLRSGATMVLVDSGLGRKNIVRCLASTSPDGFVAIPLGHALRLLKGREFPQAKLNVNVGPSWLPLGKSLASVAKLGEQSTASLPHTTADDPAAIVFTSGSTGPPKGVVYRHETFATQISEIQQMYGLESGGIDLACFPLFGLFNVALGNTTVMPEMDFSCPASADPLKLLAAANQHQVTQSFASPAVWDKLSRHCLRSGDTIPTLRHVFSCGAPVSAEVIERTLKFVHPEAQLHTPYGATECLPITTIEAREILDETQAKTGQGAGVCVGAKVDSIEWRVIKITDEPIATIDQTESLPAGEIGELIVRGPQVSRQYLEATGGKHNALAKIRDEQTVWHRMGDVGYFDDQQRFWYCGRKSQRVVTGDATLFTECVEQLVNSVECVKRSALVNASSSGEARPTIVIELEPGLSANGNYDQDVMQRLHEHPPYQAIQHLLRHPQLPTDIRHNAKINREVLAVWAAKQLGGE